MPWVLQVSNKGPNENFRSKPSTKWSIVINRHFLFWVFPAFRQAQRRWPSCYVDTRSGTSCSAGVYALYETWHTKVANEADHY